MNIDLEKIKPGDVLTFRDGTTQTVDEDYKVSVFFNGPVVYGKHRVSVDMLKPDFIVKCESKNVWVIEYENDTGVDGESYYEQWCVTDNDRAFISYDEGDAKWLCNLLNAREKPYESDFVSDPEGWEDKRCGTDDTAMLDWILNTLHNFGLNGLRRKVDWDINGPDRSDIAHAIANDDD